jgi:hypothetical protein
MLPDPTAKVNARINERRKAGQLVVILPSSLLKMHNLSITVICRNRAAWGCVLLAAKRLSAAGSQCLGKARSAGYGY